MTTPDLDRHLPLISVSFEILLVLAQDARHGYAIMRDVEERTRGEISLHPGTLYRALARLAGEGLVDEIEDTPGRRPTGAAATTPSRPWGSGSDKRYGEEMLRLFGARRREAARAGWWSGHSLLAPHRTGSGRKRDPPEVAWAPC